MPPGEAVPAAHVSQTRSVVAVPDEIAPLPALQVVHLAHEALLLATLKLPAAQTVHFRFAVAEPALATYWPAGQTSIGTQGVAALASSSHVLLAQAALGLLLPGQCVPASHAVHTAGMVAVPAFVSTVPAEQAP